MATDIDHVVNRRGPAEHFPARHRHSSAVEAKAGLAGIACIHPIRFRVELHRRARHGHRRYLGRSPASIKATRQEGSSERRDAITAPAEPPPITTKSNVPDMLPSALVALA